MDTLSSLSINPFRKQMSSEPNASNCFLNAHPIDIIFHLCGLDYILPQCRYECTIKMLNWEKVANMCSNLTHEFPLHYICINERFNVSQSKFAMLDSLYIYHIKLLGHT